MSNSRPGKSVYTQTETSRRELAEHIGNSEARSGLQGKIWGLEVALQVIGSQKSLCWKKTASLSSPQNGHRTCPGDPSILEVGQLKGWASRPRATSAPGPRAGPRPGSTWQQRESWEGPSVSGKEQPGLREKMP